MPIEVRHDPDYMAAYAQLASMRRQQQAAPAGYSANPEADANPFTMSQQRGAQLSNKLAQDRERLGQKQGPMQDSYAGFNWLTPISIKGHTDAQGRALNDTVYRNDGVDPLATGAWGALGSAEHIVNDPNNRINIQDPTDRAKVEALSRSGISGLTDERAFMSPDEIEQQKYDKQQGRKQEEFTQQLETRDVYDAKKKTRDLENKQAEDQSAVDAYQGIMDQQNDQDGVSSAEKSRLKAEMANIRKAIMKNPELKAKALPMLKRAYEQYLQLDKPVDQWADEETTFGPNGEMINRQRNLRDNRTRMERGPAPRVQRVEKTPEQKLKEDADMQRQRLTIAREFAKTPNEAQSLQDRARRSLEADPYRAAPPTPEEIINEVREIQKINEGIRGDTTPLSLNGSDPRLGKASAPPQNYTPIQAAVSSGRGQVESDPIKVTSIEDVGSLPSGTYFQDPEGNLRRVP